MPRISQNLSLSAHSRDDRLGGYEDGGGGKVERSVGERRPRDTSHDWYRFSRLLSQVGVQPAPPVVECWAVYQRSFMFESSR